MYISYMIHKYRSNACTSPKCGVHGDINSIVNSVTPVDANVSKNRVAADDGSSISGSSVSSHGG